MLEDIKIIVTQADLQRLDAEEKWVEVEDGELIITENNMTIFHFIIIQSLFRLLDPFTRQHQIGMVFIDGVRYVLEGTPQKIIRARKPDLSFVPAERITSDIDWNGDFFFAPDLVVEVASPGQTNSVLLPRITRYLQAGSEEAWLLYPKRKTLHLYRHDGEGASVYTENDILESVLFPGLKLVLKDVFALPEKP